MADIDPAEMRELAHNGSLWALIARMESALTRKTMHADTDEVAAAYRAEFHALIRVKNELKKHTGKTDGQPDD